jgi:hypothetical protein
MMTKPITELSYDKDCEFSGLPEATCSHCLKQDDSDILPESEYEIVATFDAQFHGWCNIDSEHRIKKGSKVARVQHADNPLLPVPGVACATCILDLPRAKK